MDNCQECGDTIPDGCHGVRVLCRSSERRPRTTTRDGVSGSMTNDMGPAAHKTREMVENLAEELDELRAEVRRLCRLMGEHNA